MRARRYVSERSALREGVRSATMGRRLERVAAVGMPVGGNVEGVTGLGDILWGADFPLDREDLFDITDDNDIIYYNGSFLYLIDVLHYMPEREYLSLDDVARAARETIDSEGLADILVGWSALPSDTGYFWRDIRSYRPPASEYKRRGALG